MIMAEIYEAVLDLVLKKEPFDLMEAERKKLEYRNGGEWMAARLIGKKYSHVKFRHAYAPNAPYFICRYVGYVISKVEFYHRYPGGFTVFVKPGDFIIILGKIVERGNIVKNDQ